MYEYDCIQQTYSSERVVENRNAHHHSEEKCEFFIQEKIIIHMHMYVCVRVIFL